MRCKHCGQEIRKSGDVYVTSLSLGDKVIVMKANGFNLDTYRYFSMYCNFNEDKLHEPSETSIVQDIIQHYGTKRRTRTY